MNPARPIAPVLSAGAIHPRYTLLNGKALAAALGVDRGYITAMRAHGFTFERGGRTTVQLAHAWLAQNPKFQGPPPRQTENEEPRTKN